MKKEFVFIFVILLAFIQVLEAQTGFNGGYDDSRALQNYDESKAGTYTLPELLKTQGGQTVSTVEQWEKVRRPEILKLFEDNVYGQVPKDYDDIQFKIKNTDKKAMGGKATLKEVVITVSRNQRTATINLLMFTPNKVKKPVPVFLHIRGRSPVEEVVEAGYGFAGFDVIDFAPDDREKFSQGVLDQLYPEQLAMDNGMRILGAWGWGASRAIDYFETDNSVDAAKVIIVGHSRGGKASLWCGAQDQRVAITIANNSGNSGAALSRRNFGETVQRITTGYPHWFIPNYRQYADNEDKLPVDQHMLIGLIAPRAVYVAVGSEDFWSDPKGQYLSLKEAQPVYQLYGFETNLPQGMPGINRQVIRPAMGFHNREGKHSLTPYDWQQFIRFANNWFKTK
jgi:pimeloyl-ACP methyl ester carboxylesterase